MTERTETAIAALAGAALVWLYFRSAAKTAVRRQIIAGISQLDATVGRDGQAAIRALPAQAQTAIRAEVNGVLKQHLGITEEQLRNLVADIRRLVP